VGEEAVKRHWHTTASRVAVVVAVGMMIAINILVAALAYIAIAPFNAEMVPRLGDNGTQVLLAWGGGAFGVLSAYIGFVAGGKIPPNGHGEEPNDADTS
jgi:hypothetical protein